MPRLWPSSCPRTERASKTSMSRVSMSEARPTGSSASSIPSWRVLVGAAARAPRPSEQAGPNAITLIVEDIAPPIDDRSAGLEVTSFLVLRRDRHGRCTASESGLEHWCYCLMEHVMAQDRVACELRIVHKPAAGQIPPIGSACDVLLPHRGPESYLRLSVDSLLRQTQPADILVAIDQADVGAGFLADIAGQARVEAYQLAPCPVGPLCRAARPLHAIASGGDRIPGRRRHVSAASLGDVGSRPRSASAPASLDPTSCRCMKPIERFTPSAIRSTSTRRCIVRGQTINFCFRPRSVKRDVIQRVGGFSTFRAFSLDVAFWLSASLSTRIVNVDEFLYVRRRHPASLTIAQGHRHGLRVAPRDRGPPSRRLIRDPGRPPSPGNVEPCRPAPGQPRHVYKSEDGRT